MVRKIFKRAFLKVYRKATHAQQIERILEQHFNHRKDHPVLVEVGCGVTTPVFGKWAKKLGSKVFSLDYNQEKFEAIFEKHPELRGQLEIVIGDSLVGLKEVCKMVDRIDFLFLDSAASAMHTWREFQLVEPFLKPGSVLLIDNAAVPGSGYTMTKVRKGKILVPFLLASARWKVMGLPRSGDSMVMAELKDSDDFSDPLYESPEYVDNWKKHFEARFK